MKDMQWSFIDKAGWADGPWNTEPDKEQWTDAATGLPCLLKRNRSGVLCGYVGVADGHPLHGVGYSTRSPALNKALADRLEQPLGDSPSFALMSGALCGDVGNSPDCVFSVHGGLTYSDHCAESDKEHGICHITEPGDPDPVWWFGFDCAHSGDFTPSYTARPDTAMFCDGATYRDRDYVKRECAKLAAQLAAVA